MKKVYMTSRRCHIRDYLINTILSCEHLSKDCVVEFVEKLLSNNNSFLLNHLDIDYQSLSLLSKIKVPIIRNVNTENLRGYVNDHTIQEIYRVFRVEEFDENIFTSILVHISSIEGFVEFISSIPCLYRHIKKYSLMESLLLNRGMMNMTEFEFEEGDYFMTEFCLCIKTKESMVKHGITKILVDRDIGDVIEENYRIVSGTYKFGKRVGMWISRNLKGISKFEREYSEKGQLISCIQANKTKLQITKFTYIGNNISNISIKKYFINIPSGLD